MSSAINVYAVSIERLKQVVGSRDRSAVDAIVADLEHFLSTIDDIDEDAEMTCAEAVAELVNGETSDDAPGYLYGYALEAICAHVGEELPNICPIAGASDWIEEVDAVLKRKGIPVRLSGLVFGGSPVPIPEPDDYPSIGKWPAAEVPGALKAFQSLDVTDIDDEMAETLAQMRGWLEAAAKTPGASVIGFLS
jgi:hypothetical protein